MAEQNPFNVLFNRSASTETIRLAVLQPGASADALKVSLRQRHRHESRYECIGYDRASNADYISAGMTKSGISGPTSSLAALRKSADGRPLL